VAVQLGHVDDLDLHGLLGLAVALAPDRPGVHLLGHVAERRDLADLVEVLLGLPGQRLGGFGHIGHVVLSTVIPSPGARGGRAALDAPPGLTGLPGASSGP
jgi:hypothetical protein